MNAQITLTSGDHTPSIGDDFQYNSVNSPNVDVTPTGANQTWDFSSLSGNNLTIDYIDLSSSQAPNDYSSADIVESDGSAENYFVSNSSEYTNLGTFSPGVTQVIYNDPREVLKFPMDYNDSYSETFSGTAENIAAGQTFDRAGDIEIDVDGYGQLYLPYDTIQNVLKVRSVLNYSDEQGGMNVASYTDTIIRWFNAPTNVMIASYSVNYSNGNQMLQQATYMSESDISTFLEEEEAPEEALFSIRPNPASEQLFVEAPGDRWEEGAQVRIFDMSGKQVMEHSLRGSSIERLDISELEEGIYLVRTAAGSERLIVH